VRTLVIGDIHGCSKALATLVEVVQPKPDDLLIFLGDYIDRGPDSKAVLNWIQEQNGVLQLVPLRGNHEAMILEARYDSLQYNLWSSYGGYETLISYDADKRKDWPEAIPDSHWHFLLKTKKWFQTATHIFVHGMVDSELEMAEQPEYMLLWESCLSMRPHRSGKKVICGHTPQTSGRPQAYHFGACIDTGVYCGGWLTCLNAASGDYWQANEAGEKRTGVLTWDFE
jgi:serine/threonine protein phosphatase 1